VLNENANAKKKNSHKKKRIIEGNADKQNEKGTLVKA
jgi:hypothetical protein